MKKSSIWSLLALACIGSLNLHAKDMIYPCNGAAGVYRMNPDNTPGGFVANTSIVDSTIKISQEASVCERATVLEGVEITDRAKISGKATIRGRVLVSDRAEVFGDAYVINPYGENLIINESAKIYGHAFLQGTVIVSGSTEIFGWGKVLEFAQVLGNSKICGSELVKGFDVLTDDTSRCAQ